MDRRRTFVSLLRHRTAVEHDPARNQRQRHLPFQTGFVERRVLRERAQMPLVEHIRSIGIEHDEVRRRPALQASGRQAQGFPRAAWIRREASCGSETRSAWTSRSAADSSVSSPTAPSSASAKGSRLVSTSCGLWSDTITSMVPSTRAAIIACRSSSCRSGGESLKNVR